jgi:putative FmdB family regulatory protein
VPIYDYVCGSCSHRFEVLHGLREAGPHQCPVCGGPVSRAFAPPTIVFKGSGWAKVDRRATGAPSGKAAKATGDAPGGNGGAGDAAAAPAAVADD